MRERAAGRCLALLLALAVAGCGGAPLDEAQAHLRAGRLERASELLDGHDGAAVAALRELIAARADEREAAIARLEELHGSRDQRPSADVLDDLRAVIAAADDPVVKERAEVALSSAYDWAAERSYDERHARLQAGGARRDPARSGADATSGTRPGVATAALDPIAAAALRQLDELAGAGRWTAALELARRWEQDESIGAGARARFAARREPLLVAAVAEADALVVEAWQLASAGQEARALERLSAAAPRFPADGRAGSVARTLAQLGSAGSDPLDVRVAVGDAPREDPGRVDDAGPEPAEDPATAAPAPSGDEPGSTVADAGPAAADAAERERGEPAASGPDSSAAAAAAEREAARAERLRALAAVGERLAGATRPEVRDAAFAALAAERGRDARAVLADALDERWGRALQQVERSGVLRRLERVAQHRAEVDERRAVALAAIFDEERYFYPYRPPHVSSEKAATYDAIQREVDGLVAEVEEAWRVNSSVKLNDSTRAALAELRWLRRRARYADGRLELPEGVPSWVAGLPHDQPAVTLANFAWDEHEAASLARDRSVRGYNERRWAVYQKQREPAFEAPGRIEQRQVDVTNAYRAMMGRPALAWHPGLQSAARQHSDYMNTTGEFGHFEASPGSKTPFDRMRGAGYSCGVSENCHMGSGDAEGAHRGWVRSSGHHRNLLRPDHKEMASAVAGGYWTQNFGHDTAFEAGLDLSEWLD